MLRLDTSILKFGEMGEKTGWRYLSINPDEAEKLNPGVKTSFRVKGKLDALPIKGMVLMPMGGGAFIMALKAEIRRQLGKDAGSPIKAQLELDDDKPEPPPELMTCLEDEPAALKFFKTLAPGHQNYFGNWVRSAKTEPTRAKRIARIIDAMLKYWDYGTMIRNGKQARQE